MDLVREFGHIDIYVFDQLLRGRIAPGMRIVDAGCGSGRNLVYFLRQGYDVRGVDADPHAIEEVRRLAAAEAPHASPDRFVCEPIESMTVPAGSADVVLASAVLHFARDDAHFDAMVDACWKALSPGGLFFARLASSAGLAETLRPVSSGRFVLPDGSTRYLVDEQRLTGRTAALGGELIDPLKTTLVHGQRSMTTWVVRKGGV
ncbi:MAG: class I SAM-dependent methyltransferase [Vicinamibacterales bacterium]